MRRRTGAAGTLIAIAAIMPMAGIAHPQDLDCGSFTYQEDAQAVYDANPADPNRLDEDDGPDDGIACEALPRRSAATLIPPATPPATVTPPPSTPATVTPATTAPATVTPATTAPAAPSPAATLSPTLGVRGGLGGSSGSAFRGWEAAAGAALFAGGAVAAGYVVKRRRSRS
ncbi:excalibur calcium-binding protein [Streptomyces sp. NPDC048002]|uniref:excalibur calcium-binding protein n=1 Tax=Streptomyces sp. NPDC048002 TaxID=3154344 RepID=UPI0033D505E6